MRTNLDQLQTDLASALGDGFAFERRDHPNGLPDRSYLTIRHVESYDEWEISDWGSFWADGENAGLESEQSRRLLPAVWSALDRQASTPQDRTTGAGREGAE